MKKIFFIYILLAFVNCKKEATVVQNNTTIKVADFSSVKDTLHIIGNNIWVRETPKTGKVVFKLNNNTVCEVLKKEVKDTIRQNIDFWYEIKFDNKIGWVFGSQTSRCHPCKSKKSNFKNGKSISDDFKSFLNDFLQTSFYGKNTDSLLRYKSPIIYKYIHKEIGFTRYHNPGITCVPQEYDKYNYYSKNYPKLDLSFFNDKKPEDGFCEESNSKDGVYYYGIEKLPDYPVFSKDDYIMKSIPLQKKYRDTPIKAIVVLYDKWIIKQLFFIKADDKWWLVLSDDCDCSA